MKKTSEKICILSKGILIVGFSVQIVLGLLWLILNFTKVRQAESCTGFLYPLFLKAFSQTPQILYALQLSLACYAAYVFLKPLLPVERYKKVWFISAFLSFPMAMQCHLALLPHSFIFSLFLLEYGMCRDFAKGEKERRLPYLAAAGFCWIGMALLLEEYRWLGIFPIVCTVLFNVGKLRKDIRMFVCGILIFAAVSGIAFTVSGLAYSQKESGRSFWFSMAYRMTWPTIWQDHDGWNKELLDILPEDKIWDTGTEPERMESVLRRELEGAVGSDNADACYREMALYSWRIRKSRIARQMLWDLLIYAMPQGVLRLQLEGVGYDSYSGRNYGIMSMERPLLTRYYVDYSCWWFAVSIAVTAVFLVFWKISGRKLFGNVNLSGLAAYAVPTCAVLVCYVMRGAGIADYRLTVAISAAWCVPALFCLGKDAA